MVILCTPRNELSTIFCKALFISSIPVDIAWIKPFNFTSRNYVGWKKVYKTDICIDLFDNSSTLLKRFVILATTCAFKFYLLIHLSVLWRVPYNFYVVKQKPKLTCPSGKCVKRYVKAGEGKKKRMGAGKSRNGVEFVPSNNSW